MRYASQWSSVADIKASVIQGSGLGPASYIVTAADLHPLTTGDRNKSSQCHYKWPAKSNWPRVQHTGVVHQFAVCITDSAQPRHPRNVAAWCFSHNPHLEADLLHTMVVWCLFRCWPCQAGVICQLMQENSLLQLQPAAMQSSYQWSWRKFFQMHHHLRWPHSTTLLPDHHAIPYSLRERTHNKTLISKTTP